METSYRLNVSGPAPARDVLLPAVPGSTAYEPAALDRVGEQLQRSWPVVAAGSIGGGVIGAKLLRAGGGGIFRGLAGGLAGVLAGAAVTIGGLALARGTREHRAPDAPASAGRASIDVAAHERVKVMTYNVHGGMGGPEEFGSSDAELDELAEVVRREQPDVLLLQEVDRFATRSNHVDVLAELDARLGADSAVGATALTQVTGRNQDVAVMTFNGFRVADARNIVHPDPRGPGIGTRFAGTVSDAKHLVNRVAGTDFVGDRRNQVRNTIDAMVVTPGGTNVRVLSGHYEWPTPGVDHQSRQVGAVAGALDAWRGPTIWGADFNVAAASRAGTTERILMATAGLRDTFGDTPLEQQVSSSRDVTAPGTVNRANGGIDRIYASAHARVIGTHVVRDARDASDHLPVVTELELAPF